VTPVRQRHWSLFSTYWRYTNKIIIIIICIWVHSEVQFLLRLSLFHQTCRKVLSDINYFSMHAIWEFKVKVLDTFWHCVCCQKFAAVCQQISTSCFPQLFNPPCHCLSDRLWNVTILCFRCIYYISFSLSVILITIFNLSHFPVYMILILQCLCAFVFFCLKYTGNSVLCHFKDMLYYFGSYLYYFKITSCMINNVSSVWNDVFAFVFEFK